MALPPIVTVTAQSAVIGASSNILAQAITAYRNGSPLSVDWMTVLQFFVYACISTPPNFLWQDYLERTFPANHASPPPSTSNGKDAKVTTPPRQRLHLGNTLVKLLLDQTVGLAVNSFAFALYVNGLRVSQSIATAEAWKAVLVRSRAEFRDLMAAGLSFWPFVSLFCFACVQSVETRNLVGSLAGVAWGVYVSLATAS